MMEWNEPGCLTLNIIVMNDSDTSNTGRADVISIGRYDMLCVLSVFISRDRYFVSLGT